MASIKLEIVSPDKVVYTQDIAMLIVRSTGGELGILPHHAPLVTGLVPHAMRVKLGDGDEQLIAVAGGFMEVTPERSRPTPAPRSASRSSIKDRLTPTTSTSNVPSSPCTAPLRACGQQRRTLSSDKKKKRLPLQWNHCSGKRFFSGRCHRSGCSSTRAA